MAGRWSCWELTDKMRSGTSWRRMTINRSNACLIQKVLAIFSQFCMLRINRSLSATVFPIVLSNIEKNVLRIKGICDLSPIIKPDSRLDNSLFDTSGLLYTLYIKSRNADWSVGAFGIWSNFVILFKKYIFSFVVRIILCDSEEEEEEEEDDDDDGGGGVVVRRGTLFEAEEEDDDDEEEEEDDVNIESIWFWWSEERSEVGRGANQEATIFVTNSKRSMFVDRSMSKWSEWKKSFLFSPREAAPVLMSPMQRRRERRVVVVAAGFSGRFFAAARGSGDSRGGRDVRWARTKNQRSLTRRGRNWSRKGGCSRQIVLRTTMRE